MNLPGNSCKRFLSSASQWLKTQVCQSRFRGLPLWFSFRSRVAGRCRGWSSASSHRIPLAALDSVASEPGLLGFGTVASDLLQAAMAGYRGDLQRAASGLGQSPTGGLAQPMRREPLEPDAL